MNQRNAFLPHDLTFPFGKDKDKEEKRSDV
jgi:hypothetical protein